MSDDQQIYYTFQLEFKVLRDGIPQPGWEGITPGIMVTREFLEVSLLADQFLNAQLAQLVEKALNKLAEQVKDHD